MKERSPAPRSRSDGDSTSIRRSYGLRWPRKNCSILSEARDVMAGEPISHAPRRQACCILDCMLGRVMLPCAPRRVELWRCALLLPAAFTLLIGSAIASDSRSQGEKLLHPLQVAIG